MRAANPLVDTRTINDECSRRWTEDVCGDRWTPPVRAMFSGEYVKATTSVVSTPAAPPVPIPKKATQAVSITSMDMTEEPEQPKKRGPGRPRKLRGGLGD